MAAETQPNPISYDEIENLPPLWTDFTRLTFLSSISQIHHLLRVLASPAIALVFLTFPLTFLKIWHRS
jgi:hypothetical protein